MKKRTATLQTFTMIFIMILIMMFTLAGCGGQTSGTDGETTGMAMAMDNETLVYGSGDYTAINPALYEHGEINALLFAGLTAHDAGIGILQPQPKQGGVETGQLRQGLRHRTAKTADDVVLLQRDQQAAGGRAGADCLRVQRLDAEKAVYAHG